MKAFSIAMVLLLAARALAQPNNLIIKIASNGGGGAVYGIDSDGVPHNAKEPTVRTICNVNEGIGPSADDGSILLVSEALEAKRATNRFHLDSPRMKLTVNACAIFAYTPVGDSWRWTPWKR